MKKTQISIPAVQVNTFQVTIVGNTPLICHRFSEKDKTEMRNKMMGIPRGARENLDPEADYRGSLYTAEAGWYGFPVDGIKKACVQTAMRFVDDLKGTEARGAFFIVSQGLERGTRQQLVKLEGEPEMLESVCPVRGVAHLRYRALFPEWSATFDVRHSPNTATVEIIVALLQATGFHTGIGDWRPGTGGMHGMFHVLTS